jgi:ferredoxin
VSALQRIRAARERPTGQKLRVDPLVCEGIGQCAMTASRLVQLDRWGYPIVPTEELGASDLGPAQRAVNSCPKRALWLEELD